jgi:AraC family transcriptional regulator
MNLARPISRGWHFGSSSRTARLGRFVLSETQYAGDLRTPWHGHEAPAFCLVLKGWYVQRFRRCEVVYQPAAALFRPGGVEHTDHISPEGAACFIIEPDAAWLAGAGLEGLNRDHTLARTGARARWLFEHALGEFRAPDAVTPLALEGLVLALGAEFARVAGPATGRPRPAWLLRAREALDAGFTARLTLADLATEAGVHPVHLATAFRAAFGTSVGEYVRARRVEAGRLALRNPHRSISEIALTLGFSSQSHFTRVFRRQTGLTPLGYRRMHTTA